jgi:neutral ceramidase
MQRMRCGTSQLCITPPVGVELAGFAARRQPSVGVHDDLYARGLCLEQGQEKLLWLHADLLGFEQRHVRRLRSALARQLGLAERQILFSATHTHSGPATLLLRSVGSVDAGYMLALEGHLVRAAGEAIAHPTEVTLHYGAGICHLGVDRRPRSRLSHADPALPVLAFRASPPAFAAGSGDQQGQDYVAVVANYAMHNVALPGENRHISADVAGAAARFIQENLPGRPVVLFTNGGGGNVNPPASSTDFAVMEQFGQVLGRTAVYTAQVEAQDYPEAALASQLATVELPLIMLTPDLVEREYERAMAECQPGSVFWEKARQAYADWRAETLAWLAQGKPAGSVTVDLQAVKIGPVRLIAIGAEVFSRMAEDLRHAMREPRLYVIGYANGDIGYLPPRAIYAEGGYEVDMAYKFYGNFMVAPGAFETLRKRALGLIERVKDPPPR